MEVEYGYPSCVTTFGELEEGRIFCTADFSHFVKIHYGLNSTGREYNAICIDSGHRYFLERNEMVTIFRSIEFKY